MKVIRSVKVWTDGFKNVAQNMEDLLVLYDFYEMEEATEEDIEQHFNETLSLIEALEVKNMLRKEEDKLGAADAYVHALWRETRLYGENSRIPCW